MTWNCSRKVKYSVIVYALIFRFGVGLDVKGTKFYVHTPSKRNQEIRKEKRFKFQTLVLDPSNRIQTFTTFHTLSSSSFLLLQEKTKSSRNKYIYFLFQDPPTRLLHQLSQLGKTWLLKILKLMLMSGG